MKNKLPIEFKTTQIALTSDKKEFFVNLAYEIKEALEYAFDAFTKYDERYDRFANIENHEILFEDNIVIYATALIEERPNNYYFSIDEIAVQLDGEEVDLIIGGESLKNMKSNIEKILTN